MDDLVTRHEDGPVLTLQLGGGRAHALSLGMIRALHDALDAAAAEAKARLIVIHGPGSIYCAGHDLKEIARHRNDADHGRAYLTELFEACAALMTALVRHPIPTLARVEGIATAGGAQLVASCDLALASPAATFALPGVQNGGFCTTPSVAVGRVIGRRHLLEMALTGDAMDAHWARATGLVNAVLEANALDARIAALGETLSQGNPPAIAAGKRLTHAQLEMPLEQAYAEATPVMVGHFMDPERISRDLSRWA